MLQISTLQFLKQLKKNNNKNWFDLHRTEYELAKADFLELTGRLISGIALFDKPIGNLNAKNCIFRINRDIRFSKDKSPYKTNMGAYFNIGGKKSNTAGYYIHVEPGKSFIAGGCWMPDPASLAQIRQEIDYNYAEWRKIITSSSFKKLFPTGIEGIDILARPPKGYDESNPAITYLKMKSFIMSKPLTDEILLNKTGIKEQLKTMKAMKPVIDFLNRGTGM